MTAPVKPTATLPQRAGILCNDPEFRRWVGQHLFGQPIKVSPLAAAEFLRAKCGIDSRRELATNPRAALKLETLRTEYDAARGRIGRPR